MAVTCNFTANFSTDSARQKPVEKCSNDNHVTVECCHARENWLYSYFLNAAITLKGC